MLEDILDYIHNYFVKETHIGTYMIESGKLDLPFLMDGQYFRIVGSVFNDGVHLYNSELSLKDESFDGEVWALAIPSPIIALSNDITNWVNKYGEFTTSPYQSESFGGYSYTKSNGGSNGSSNVGWKDVFKSRLNRWRKLA